LLSAFFQIFNFFVVTDWHLCIAGIGFYKEFSCDTYALAAVAAVADNRLAK